MRQILAMPGRFAALGGGAGMMSAEAMDDDEYIAASESQMDSATTQVRESVISTSFEISRRSTIPSDNNQHKVTVALVDLTPDFSYEAVPCKAEHAYLTGKIKNTSTYPFLPGPMNVFLDNNFICKSNLKAVSPQEEFTCSLGVDPAIRVNFKPARKFNEESGLLTKSKITTVQQPIEIKNTHTNVVKVKVIDHLPLSSEEKLKVNLLEPNLKENQKSAGPKIELNKAHNLEWFLEIPAGESREIIVKYSIEHPKNEEVEFKEE